jgi:hypothetical protein
MEQWNKIVVTVAAQRFPLFQCPNKSTEPMATGTLALGPIARRGEVS